MTPLLALATIPLALVVGTLALFVARARALRRPFAPIETHEPLAPGELARLELWERRLRGAVALVVTTYLVALMVALSGGARSAIGPRMAILALGLACVAGAAVQFSARCPRCGFNLGFQARLVVPERCERCGVSYTSPSTNEIR